MALGGGVFTTTNKILPGSYVNVVSKSTTNSLVGERGTVAIVLPLDWGSGQKVITLTADQFYTDSNQILGYSAISDNANMIVLREIFAHASKVIVYNLNHASTKATCTEEEGLTAAQGGVRGNDLSVTFTTNSVDSTKTDVVVKLGTVVVASQTVGKDEVPKSNAWVTFPEDMTIPATGTVYTFSGGAAGTPSDVDSALKELSYEDFNILCAYTATEQAAYIGFTKTQRDDVGKKFQCVVYNTPTANHEGVISVQNAVSETPNHALVAWVAGAEAGCAVNKSVTNKIYDGELTVVYTETQSELTAALKEGKFMFHRVGDDVRVLDDINTYTGNTVEKNGEFGYNQTIRVIDQIANDISYLFNTKYIGNIANNAAGRISLWNDVVKHHKELELIEAIEEFDSAEIVVTPHESDKRAVILNDAIRPVNCMTKMYMTLYIS